MTTLIVPSLRATVEFHGADKLPPIRIVIADGEDNEDVVIKVMEDQRQRQRILVYLWDIKCAWE